jgi:hypothetical protein
MEYQTMTTAIQTQDVRSGHPAIEALKHEARMLAATEAIPKHWRGNAAGLVAVIAYARSIGIEPLYAARGLYMVHGSIGMTTEFMLSVCRMKGVLSGWVNYVETGTPGQDDYTVCVELTNAEGQTARGTTVTMAMVRGEKWDVNPHYKHMPQRMMRNRALTFAIREYCPEVMAQTSHVEELEDVEFAGEATVVRTAIPRRATPDMLVDMLPEEPEPEPDPTPAVRSEAARGYDDNALDLE